MVAIRGSFDLVVSPVIPTPPVIAPPVDYLGPLRAFPFAQGYKVNSSLTGGRVLGGGEIRKVTNLLDSGAGSFRQALSTPGPADVIFEVAGVIPLASGIQVSVSGNDSNISIWGETAPSPGISIYQTAGFNPANPCLDIRGRNVIVRHLRFRMNPALDNTTFQLFGFQSGGITDQRAIVANCSFAYDSDEMVYIARDGAADQTIYRCILGPGSGIECKSLLMTGFTTSLGPQRAALIQNFFPLTSDRCPEFHSGGEFVMYNNYIYGCGHPVAVDPTCFQGFFAFGAGVAPFPPVKVSLRGNRYDGCPTNNRPQFEFDTGLTDSTPDHESYFDDNVNIVRCVQAPAIVTARALETDLTMVLPEVGPSLVLPSSGIKEYILSNVGARPSDRDSVDSLSVANARNSTGAVSFAAPPAYSLGVASRPIDIPANWNQQAPGQAAGWRVIDSLLRQYAVAVGDLG